MPSVWNFVGVDARTALTALLFQVMTASGGVAASRFAVADAADSHVVATAAATIPSTSSVLVRTFRLVTSPPRLVESGEESWRLPRPRRAATPLRARAACRALRGRADEPAQRDRPRRPRGL